MIHITVTRDKSETWGTPGLLNIEGHDFLCNTLELPWHDNERGKSCIIADSYRARPWYSPTFKRMVLRLEDKHGRKDCLVHPGNFAGDVDAGLVTEVHGCTEVGHGLIPIQRVDGKMQMGVAHAKRAMDQLMAEIGQETDLVITYFWMPGAEPKECTS